MRDRRSFPALLVCLALITGTFATAAERSRTRKPGARADQAVGTLSVTDDLLRVVDVAVAPEFMSPEASPGVQDDTSLTLELAVRKTAELIAIEQDPDDTTGAQFVVRLAWNVVADAGDRRVRRLEREVPLQPPFDTVTLDYRAAPLGADAAGSRSGEFVQLGNLRPVEFIRVALEETWDGRDEDDLYVADGSYVGLVEVALVRVRATGDGPLEQVLATARPTHGPVVVDNVAPQIQLAAAPPPNAFGWNRTDVAVTFDASDEHSGIASVSPPVLLQDEGAGQLVVGTALDRAGNGASVQATVNIDRTAPGVTIDSPPDGEFVIDSPLQVGGTAADGNALQSLLVCGAPTAVVGTAFTAQCALELGSNTIVAVATDIADNSATASIDASLGRCFPDTVEPCYDGPDGTAGVGACAAGEQHCLTDGLDYGPCEGQVLPSDETCNALDDDCDGVADSGLDDCQSIDALPSPDPDPCDLIDGPCDSIAAGPYSIFSVPAEDGVATTATDETGDVLYVSWRPGTDAIEVVVTFPELGSTEPMVLEESLPTLRGANVATVAILGLGPAGSSADDAAREHGGNHAGCDVIDDWFPFRISCTRFGFCCDLHDACIHWACRGDDDSGNLLVCLEKEAAYWSCRRDHDADHCNGLFPRCSLGCNVCHAGVIACFVHGILNPGTGFPSACCFLGNCGEAQACILGTIVITNPDVCEFLGLPAEGSGDPHYITFDQMAYDFQAVGEFALVRSLDDDLEIQARTRPWGGSRFVSVHGAIAMNVAGDRVGVYLDPSQRLRINGVVDTTGSGTIALPLGGSVLVTGNEIAVTWPDGSRARIVGRGSHLNLTVRLNLARQGWVEGLLGNFDGSRVNELVVRDGLPIGTRPSAAVFYGEYGNSWRVDQADSLFDYADGETTETFTDLTFPGAVVTAASLPPALAQAAREICEAAGITDPVLLDACILDVALTDDPSFADDAAQIMPPGQATNIDVGALKSGGLRLRMYDTPSAAAAVQNGFAGLTPGPFTLTTAATSAVVTTAVIPVVNFPDTGYDQAAFYGVGPNGVVDAGSTPAAPQGDDVAIQPPGGNDTFGGAFRGYVYLPSGGDVTFTVGVDDFFDLIVDGQSVLSNLGVTNFRYFTVTVPGLPSGPVPIVVNFGEQGGEANIVLIGSGGGLPGGVVPAELLLYEGE